MILISFVFISALLLEVIATTISVIGLSSLFGANILIIALAVSLDLAKLVTVTTAYTHWRELPKIMKGYALIAATITMIITSAGSAGYLSSEFQKAIVGTQESSLKVDVLKQQQAKYEERKKQIDTQIAALPEKTSVNQRLRLMNGFKTEQQNLQDKINQIDKDLPTLQVSQIGAEAHAGPILYIAKAFSVPVEVAVKYVILLIIFVFDPLAVFLIIAGNFLLKQHRSQDDLEYETDVQHFEPDPLYIPPMPQVKPPKEEPTEEEQKAPQAEVKIRELLAEPVRINKELAELPVGELREIVPEPDVPTPMPPYIQPVDPPREKITLSSLRKLRPAPEIIPHATLADVPADETVEFEQNPSRASKLYNPKP